MHQIIFLLDKMKILVLGGTGLLGNAVVNVLDNQFDTIGTSRKEINRNKDNLIYTKDLSKKKNIKNLIEDVAPDVIVNCLSVNDINSQNLKTLKKFFIVIPQYIAFLCNKYNIKLVHISSDAVFSGKKGNYKETDQPDPNDDYGICKLLGEPAYPNTSIIRTSMIGHSINGESGLLDWFLKQEECKLYKNAIFSGLPVYELARIISKFFINNLRLNGIFHISSDPISKYDLLKKVKNVYNLDINIMPDYSYSIDRSLDSSKFKKISKYKVLSWDDMILRMKEETYRG